MFIIFLCHCIWRYKKLINFYHTIHSFPLSAYLKMLETTSQYYFPKKLSKVMCTVTKVPFSSSKPIKYFKQWAFKKKKKFFFFLNERSAKAQDKSKALSFASSHYRMLESSSALSLSVCLLLASIHKTYSPHGMSLQ